MIDGFRLIATGMEEKRTVALHFVVRLPWTESLHNWCASHLHKDFFCETVPSQKEMFEEEKPPKGKKTAAQPQLVQ